MGPVICAVIATWNAVACAMMIECKEHALDQTIPSHMCVSSTYSRIAYVGLGWLGMAITDLSVIVTLLGVCVAYQITFSSLLSAVPAISLSGQALTCVSGMLVLPLCLSGSFRSLSSLSLLGLLCLCLGSLAILYFGFCSYGSAVYSDPFSQLSAWPANASALASFVGIAAFCFGLPPLAFPLQESMQDKSQFNLAVAAALLFVWTVYVVIGDLGALLYVHSAQGVAENVLSDLPMSSPLALAVRLCMAMVCVLTFPLTFLPPAQMIQKYLQISRREACEKAAMSKAAVRGYGSLQSTRPAADRDAEEDAPLLSPATTAPETPAVSPALHCALVAACTCAAVFVPCFATVISVLGAMTVALLSFVLPPLLHLAIVSYPRYVAGARQAERWQLGVDVVLLVCGLLLSALSSFLIVAQAAAKVRAGEGC